MIIARVALGKAWSSDTSTKLYTTDARHGIRLAKFSSIRFGQNPTSSVATGDSRTLNNSQVISKPAEEDYDHIVVTKTVDVESMAT